MQMRVMQGQLQPQSSSLSSMTDIMNAMMPFMMMIMMMAMVIPMMKSMFQPPAPNEITIGGETWHVMPGKYQQIKALLS